MWCHVGGVGRGGGSDVFRSGRRRRNLVNLLIFIEVRFVADFFSLLRCFVIELLSV
jgi:hypothetical protein